MTQTPIQVGSRVRVLAPGMGDGTVTTIGNDVVTVKMDNPPVWWVLRGGGTLKDRATWPSWTGPLWGVKMLT